MIYIDCPHTILGSERLGPANLLRPEHLGPENLLSSERLGPYLLWAVGVRAQTADSASGAWAQETFALRAFGPMKLVQLQAYRPR